MDALCKGRAVGQNSKLRTYAKIKHSVTMENYLLHNGLSWKQKSTLAKFRLSDHKLRIETGRHSRPRLPVEQRLCQRCNLQSVEDEIHFMIVCPYYEDLRIKHCIPTYFTNNECGFIEIMCEDGPAAWRNLVGYLDDALMRINSSDV